MSSKKICFLSMDGGESYEMDDDLAIPFLEKLGWTVNIVSWTSVDHPWNTYDAVIIRSTWDYQKSPKEYLNTLRHIESQTKLENPSKIVEWNLSKKIYLQDLRNKGVPVVPTLFQEDAITKELFDCWLAQFRCEELIIKPVISASAGHTYRRKAFDPKLATIFDGHRDYMVQPFMKNIVTEGEYSLFYFADKFSHAMLKTPKQGDFRVQEDFGGHNQLIEKPTSEMLKFGSDALEKIGQKLLYARVDFVKNTQGEWMLMELELIEPSLYMRVDPEAPARFANAVHEWLV